MFLIFTSGAGIPTGVDPDQAGLRAGLPADPAGAHGGGALRQAPACGGRGPEAGGDPGGPREGAGVGPEPHRLAPGQQLPAPGGPGARAEGREGGCQPGVILQGQFLSILPFFKLATSSADSERNGIRILSVPIGTRFTFSEAGNPSGYEKRRNFQRIYACSTLRR